ncbi:NADP-dependent oxidoreductase [Aeromicrobium sp.]|uniref:NADP-dependent oxidoreductase n=1 Tax=Aeromicrobium sp. TaxID=1871063 RepID=UPI003C600B83
MRAVTCAEFGGPEVLTMTDVPDPEAGPGQVRVAVSAIGVNRFDGKVRSGSMESMFSTPLPKVLGLELVGVVDQTGEGITDVAVGDRVAGWAVGNPGAYAERALMTTYARVPEGVSDEVAAAAPVATEAARRVLDAVGVERDTAVVIHGASGGVGAIAVQQAVARGATVLATASAAHHQRLRALGALPISYDAGWADRAAALVPSGIQAVVDTAGRGLLPESVRLVGSADRVVTIADPDADELGVEFSSAADNRADLLADDLAAVERGDLEITVAHVLPLAEAAEAHRIMDGGHAGGKVVLRP